MQKKMLASVSKQKKICDVRGCKNMTVREFSRATDILGRIDLCQECINAVGVYAEAITPARVTEFRCQYCEFVCASKIGIQSHEKACKAKV